MRIFWAMALILFGLGYLGAGLGWWGYDVVHGLWQFWPLLLVFWGLELITKKTVFYLPVMIGALVLSGAFIYTTLYQDGGSIGSGLNSTEAQTSEITVGLADTVKEADLTVNTGAIDFGIAGTTEALLSGSLFSSVSSPEVKTEISGEKATVVVSTLGERSEMRRMRWGESFENRLRLALNEKIPYAIDVRSGASKINLDLTNYILSALSIHTGASTVDVKVGDKVKDGATITLEAGASTANIDFPDNVGVKITAETGLASKEFEGYTEKDGAFYSPNYDSRAVKVELVIKSGLSSIKVK